jgi:hypothetical protein
MGIKMRTASSYRRYTEQKEQGNTMTIQEAMNKAVEGGYHIHGSDGMDTYYEGATNDYAAWTRNNWLRVLQIPLTSCRIWKNLILQYAVISFK